MGIDVYTYVEVGDDLVNIDDYTKTNNIDWTALLGREPNRVGYLRESYHGGPYGTKDLVLESFYNTDRYPEIADSPYQPVRSTVDGWEGWYVHIPPMELERRLVKTLETVRTRIEVVYPQANPSDVHWQVQQFEDFVAVHKLIGAGDLRCFINNSY